MIQKDPTAGGRSTRYRVDLSQNKPVRLIDELKWS